MKLLAMWPWMRTSMAKWRATNQNATSNRAYAAQAARIVRSTDFAGRAAIFPIALPKPTFIVSAD